MPSTRVPITGDGNWTWLIPGRVPTLIDAGTGEAAHLEAIDEALEGAALTQVLVTHAHTDHAAGAPALASRLPSAPISARCSGPNAMRSGPSVRAAARRQSHCRR